MILKFNQMPSVCFLKIPIVNKLLYSPKSTPCLFHPLICCVLLVSADCIYESILVFICSLPYEYMIN